MTFVIATFYQFFSFPDRAERQPEWFNLCLSQGIKGTLLLAPEGINGTLAGSRSGIDTVLTGLRSDPRLQTMDHKESRAGHCPFGRLKVRLRPELVPLGISAVDPAQQVGTYVEPQDWNSLIANPEVTLIDTRNQYEVAIGTFKGAQNPALQSFRQFPDYVHQHLDPSVHKKVAMFCTGGIRCEKATSYLIQQGFEEVYHLKGGILKYLETIDPNQSLWQGECFVFDERVAVIHGLQPGSYEMCLACGHPISEADKQSPAFVAGAACPHCAVTETEDPTSPH
ncbi:MAG: rhodanese-related sulfurtransferase [Synechococcales bacterium]|nr:rhodanese-related sulfurtransferase [Synechococcales bacterium]